MIRGKGFGINLADRQTDRQTLLLKEEIIRFHEGLLPISGNRPFFMDAIHLCKEVRAFKNFNTFQSPVEAATDMSRQCEGWIKSASKQK